MGKLMIGTVTILVKSNIQKIIKLKSAKKGKETKIVTFLSIENSIDDSRFSKIAQPSIPGSEGPINKPATGIDPVLSKRPANIFFPRLWGDTPLHARRRVRISVSEEAHGARIANLGDEGGWRPVVEAEWKWRDRRRKRYRAVRVTKGAPDSPSARSALESRITIRRGAVSRPITYSPRFAGRW